MYNKNILCDLIRIKLLKSKLYILASKNTIDVMKTILKYYNNLIKSINREFKETFSYIELSDVIWSKDDLIIKNFPKPIYEYKIVEPDDSLYRLEYVDGLDCIISKKENKKTSTILMLVYQSSFKGLQLKNGLNIWHALPKIDYNLYQYMLKFMESENTIILRTILYSDCITMEELYLNIYKGISMHDKLKIKLVYYEINNIITIEKYKTLLNLNYVDNTDKYIVIQKNKIMLHAKVNKYKIINTDLAINGQIINYIIIYEGGYTKLDKIYNLQYYNIDKDLFIMDNKLFSDNININHKLPSLLLTYYIYNYTIYKTNSVFIKLCITNNIVCDNINEFENLTIDEVKLKIKDNVNLLQSLNKLLTKSVSYHLKEISNCDDVIEYDSINDIFISSDGYYDYIYNILQYIYTIGKTVMIN